MKLVSLTTTTAAKLFIFYVYFLGKLKGNYAELAKEFQQTLT